MRRGALQKCTPNSVQKYVSLNDKLVVWTVAIYSCWDNVIYGAHLYIYIYEKQIIPHYVASPNCFLPSAYVSKKSLDGDPHKPYK